MFFNVFQYISIFFNVEYSIKGSEIPEEENEDDLSSKLKKAESDNEKASNLSKSRIGSRMGDPNERVQIILKKHELKEQKLNEQKKITEEEVF